ncbi:methylcrotonoyl-CoA carboxylase subunit alpha, mitochondrial isoform X2 [Anthonomus grandis grandis]|nr:methylcrotonoyl-CoA carboxylase subunit alpha, mitochondrial isoform X2 [Anthonomus grandis grandis]
MKTAKKLGIRTVAVYSEADKDSLHVALANEAYQIGPAPAAQSYLRGDKLLDIAKKSGCQAVHPGYGFLSENVEFAELCQKEDVIFIGPPASAIRDMGIKSTSKHIMSKAGVPIIEGYHGEDQSNETLQKHAERIGFPIMIKAVRGGGGKGMRIARSKEEFLEALESARSESQKSFGDSVVLLEKFVEEPRHVEVQVFADKHGNAVYLYERDCSVQRRHQKIIEEAPAPGLSWDLRKQLGTAAVKAAKAVGYVGAGTVEFIFDRKTSDFHFMEMNTRLQVEHPITEMITGTDLVEWQIKIAAGEEIPLKQADIPLKGHSLEARIYAEDPRGGFLPGAGPLQYLATPTPDDDVRVETGVRQGDNVSVHYDPMIAKLAVWGQDRSEALTKLRSKLLEYHIAGLETNVNFLLNLSGHPEFKSGNVHTNFIRDHHDSLFRDETPCDNNIIQASMALILWEQSLEGARVIDRYNPFIVENNFRINHLNVREVKLLLGETEFCTKVKFTNPKRDVYEVTCDNGKTWRSVNARLKSIDNLNLLTCRINDHSTTLNVFKTGSNLVLFGDGGKQQFSIPSPSYTLAEDSESLGGSNKAVAPMPGVLEKVLVNIGDEVKRGDSLFVLIAMKMEHVVKAAKDAKIVGIHFKAGESVMKDVAIVEFESK